MPPPIEKPYPSDAKRISLSAPGQWQGIGKIDLEDAIMQRQSIRKYNKTHLTLDELSFLLWTTQGIKKIINRATALRTVPSAGARHSFETYLAIFNVTGLDPGIFRYLPVGHELLHIKTVPDLAQRISEATLGQSFTGQSAVTFIWSCIPYRMEWRYGLASYKVIALDAGHVCQNLYLACRAVGAGTCAIAAYDQDKMDSLIGVDGKDEFAIYIAPVGKIV